MNVDIWMSITIPMSEEERQAEEAAKRAQRIISGTDDDEGFDLEESSNVTYKLSKGVLTSVFIKDITIMYRVEDENKIFVETFDCGQVVLKDRKGLMKKLSDENERLNVID